MAGGPVVFVHGLWLHASSWGSWAEVFGESARTSHKVWLIKRIVWRLQSLAEGDLSERARRRAAELANDADLRLYPPRSAQVVSSNKASTPSV